MSDSESTVPGGPTVMRLRYSGTCETCGASLPAGTTATYDRLRRKVRCVQCPTTSVAKPTTTPTASGETAEAKELPAADKSLAAGIAGGSALRIYERRSAGDRARQEARVAEDRAWREKAKKEHPFFGRIASAITPKEVMTPEPQHVTAWKAGADGEQRIGQRLDEWSATGAGVVLHDRRMPNSKANIDHIAIAPSGIYVIDAKRYEGKVEAVDVGGWFKTDVRLKVRGRDKTKLTLGVDIQVAAVSAVLAGARSPELRPSVQGVLCFIDAHWGWLAKPFRVRDVIVAWPTATVEILGRPGPWGHTAIVDIAGALARSLRPA